MSRARQLSSISALVRQILSRDASLVTSRCLASSARADDTSNRRIQVPAVRQPPLQIRTLNTAASVPSSTAANLAAIDPPVQTSQTGSPESQVEFRAQWAHALRNALRSTKHLESVMESMDRYLRTAKAEVDEGGKSSLFLDHQIISNYIDCEDVLISHYEQQGDMESLENTLHRLSLLIQNMHLFMVHTRAWNYEDCSHKLFRRYMTTCRITGNAQKARRAWNALLRTSNARLLQDVDMCMVYVKTLLGHARVAPEAEADEYFDDAIRELAKWKLRPPAQTGRSVAEGHADGDVPRHFDLNKHGASVGSAYSDALFLTTKKAPYVSTRLQHAIFSNMRAVRQGLAVGERVPETLSVSNFMCYNILSNICRLTQQDLLNAPPNQVEDVLRYALEDIEMHISRTASHQNAGVTRAPLQFVDEGLVQNLCVVCERLQSAPLALMAFNILRRTTERLPVPPGAEEGSRHTTLTGVRVPTTLTYLGAIHACCADPDDSQLLPALRLVAELEQNYVAADGSNLGKVEALGPVNLLRALAQRIGRSTETWQTAWEAVETLDKEGILRQSHFNVLIAGLGHLPDGATIPQPAASDGSSQDGSTSSTLVQKAAELHTLMDRCFDGKVSVHTFNALLSVFCRPDGGQESTQYIMNLLQLMDEGSVAKNFETFTLLINHWARRRVYGALLATVEDMREADLRPAAPELVAAANKAEANQMHDEAKSIRDAIQDLGYSQQTQVRRRYQRPIDDRGRVMSE